MSAESKPGSSFDVARARALLAEREEFDRRRDPTRRGIWLTRPAVEIALRDACDEIERLREALYGIKWQAGSTPSKQVLGSIVRRVQDVLP